MEFDLAYRFLSSLASAVWVDFVRAVAWPAAVLAMALILAFSGRLRTLLSRVAGRFRRVSAFGVELELTEQAASEVREVTDEAFGTLRRRIRSEFDRQIHIYLLNDKRKRLVEGYVKPTLRKFQPKGNLPDFRCTVHVPDILFAETLYQLLDYYPAGGGRGRTFSIRFGIAGKAWRSGRTERVNPFETLSLEKLGSRLASPPSWSSGSPVG